MWSWLCLAHIPFLQPLQLWCETGQEVTTTYNSDGNEEEEELREVEEEEELREVEEDNQQQSCGPCCV